MHYYSHYYALTAAVYIHVSCRWHASKINYELLFCHDHIMHRVIISIKCARAIATQTNAISNWFVCAVSGLVFQCKFQAVSKRPFQISIICLAIFFFIYQRFQYS